MGTVPCLVLMYSSPTIARPLPPETTSSYTPEMVCTDALTIHVPPTTDHPFNATRDSAASAHGCNHKYIALANKMSSRSEKY